MSNDKTVLFSGRFDNVHPGHIITIQKLGKEYGKVYVVILDYPDQVFSIEERFKTMTEVLDNSIGNYTVMKSPYHFGYITKEQIEEFPAFDVYVAAENYAVLDHIRSLKCCDVVNVPRYPGYTAADSRKYSKIMKFLEQLFK